MNYFNGKLSLYQFPQTALRGPSMGYVWQTETGKTIMIDGGITPETDGVIEYLKTIAEKDGKIVIDAWFLTHAHTDHINVLVEILDKHLDKFIIENVYYNFPSMEYLISSGEKQEPSNTQKFYDLIKEKGISYRDDISLGEEFTYDALTLKVIYTYNEDIKINHVNNSTTVLKAYTGGKSVIFLGDLGAEAGDELLNSEYSNELPSDIVQMAHHGQAGVRESLYKAIGAKISLWPTPDWLYKTPTEEHHWLHCDIVRKWLDDLGNFERYIAKDGGILLK